MNKTLTLMLATLAGLSGIMAEERARQPAGTIGEGPFNTVWPGFPRTRDARRAGFSKEKSRQSGSVVFLGDSITEGFDTAKAFPELRTANRGISGDTSRGMLARLDEDVITLNPKAVVILCGINDLSQPGGAPRHVAANIRAMLEMLHERAPGIPLFVVEVMPSASRATAAIRETNAAVDNATAGRAGVMRVKVFQALADPDGHPRKTLFRDGTHLNAAGYAAYAPILRKAFKEAGLLPSTSP